MKIHVKKWKFLSKNENFGQKWKFLENKSVSKTNISRTGTKLLGQNKTFLCHEWYSSHQNKFPIQEQMSPLFGLVLIMPPNPIKFGVNLTVYSGKICNASWKLEILYNAVLTLLSFCKLVGLNLLACMQEKYAMLHEN